MALFIQTDLGSIPVINPTAQKDGQSVDGTGMAQQPRVGARDRISLPIGRGEQKQKQCAVGVISGCPARAFGAAHHDMAFDGANAPPPSFAALAQRYLKGLKFVRQHVLKSTAPPLDRSAGPAKGSTLTARCAKIYGRRRGRWCNQKLWIGSMQPAKNYLKLKIIRCTRSNHGSTIAGARRRFAFTGRSNFQIAARMRPSFSGQN